MKNKLKKPETAFELLCTHSPTASFIVNPYGNILHANPSAYRMFGYAEGDLDGILFGSFFKHEADRKAFLNFIKGAGSSLCLYEIETLRKDATSFFTDVYLKVLSIEGMRLTMAFFQDITELRALLMEKKAGETLLNNVFSAIKDGISLLDRDLNIVRVNPWMESRYRNASSLMGRKCYEVYQLRQEPCPWCPSIRAMETGQTQHAVVPYPSASDLKGWLELSSYPVRNNQGEITGVVEYVKDITRQKRLQDVLAESEKKYRDFFENLDLCAYRVTKDGKILDINSAGIKFFGYTKAELLGLNILDTYEVPEERKQFLDEIEKKGAVHDYPARLKRKDGTVRSCRITAVPLKDNKGRGIGQQGIIRDVTDQERLRTALMESEERYRIFFENSAVFAYITDKNGKILNVNRAALNLLGYEKDEFLRLNAFDIYVNPEERSRFIQEIEAKGMVKDYPIHLKRKDGSILTCLDTSTLVRDENGSLVVYQGILRDVTEKIRQERELRKFQALLLQANAGIIVTNPQGRIEYVNPAFEKITGYRASEAKGQNPKILKSGKQDATFYKTLWDTITSGKSWDGRFINKRKDGTLYHEAAHIFPIFDTNGNIQNFAAIKRDITKEVAMEEQLQQAAKLEAIGQLVGGIAHDYNNILTSIRGFAELGLSKLSPQSPLWKELSEIYAAAEQAVRITQQLLGFSRKQMIAPRVMSANRVIKEMAPLLKRYMGEDIHLDVQTSPERDTILADRGQFEQCLLNLVINARDAIWENENRNAPRVITLETYPALIDRAYLQDHVGIEEGNYLVIAVSDTGTGMDKETMNKIFEPFFTTKPEGKGTGLGCATVFGIVKQNGGNVRVYSERGVGTTVKIYWPLATSDVTTETKEEVSPPPTLSGSETILVVEDDASIRSLVCQALQDTGYRVIEAESGEKALKLVKEKNIMPHLLFSDIIMPGVSGNDLAATLKAALPSLKILFTSGYTENHIFHNGILAPGTHFLHKPYTIRNLLEKVRTVLDSI